MYEILKTVKEKVIKMIQKIKTTSCSPYVFEAALCAS